MVKKKTKQNASYESLSLIMLDSVIRVNKKHYPQTLLEECIYEIKKTKKWIMNDDLNSGSSDNETDNDFDNEADNEYNNDESNE